YIQCTEAAALPGLGERASRRLAKRATAGLPIVRVIDFIFWPRHLHLPIADGKATRPPARRGFRLREISRPYSEHSPNVNAIVDKTRSVLSCVDAVACLRC